MRLKLVAPTKRKHSANLQFERRIPGDLKARLSGKDLHFPLGSEVVSITITNQMQSIRFSLRTADADEAKQRQADVLAYLERVFKSLRANAPVALSERQQKAIAADHAKAFFGRHEDNPSLAPPPDPIPELPEAGDAAWKALVLEMAPTEREALLGDLGALLQENEEGKRSSLAFTLLARYPRLKVLLGPDLTAGLEALYGADTDAALASKGLYVDEEMRRLVNLEMVHFMGVARRGIEARSGGDYDPVRGLEAAPSFVPTPKAAPTVSLQGLFDGWWKEAERAGKTVSAKESFGKAMEALVAFLKHDDATRVTPLDAVAFKDHLLSLINPRTKRPLSVNTISGSYLGGLKVVFKWAVENKRLPSNPFAEVKTVKRKRVRKRDSWFSPEERKAILNNASASVRRNKEPWQRFEGRRWVPWLCAYSGARVGEMVQLRKEDIRQKEGHWVLTITPESGTVKTGEMREVPIHAHLEEMGFLEFVSKAPDGHLFMWSGDGRSAWRTAKNRLTGEIRTVVTDPNVQPNHGWRHTFKTIGREAGLQDFLLDAITGHAPRTEGDKYGGATIAAKVKAMEAFPRYDTESVNELTRRKDS